MSFSERGIEPADGFAGDGFIVRPLVPTDVALDHDAVMASREFLYHREQDPPYPPVDFCFGSQVMSQRAAAPARDDAVRVNGFEVAPLDADRFQDFVTVLGRGGISGCWCMYWIAPSSNAWAEGTVGGSRAPNRNHFHDLVEAGPPPGLIAYDNEQPIAWCRVMPRHRMPGLANSRHFKTDLDIEGVWALSCFVVKKTHRGRGLTTVLTKAAISFVNQQGGSVVEVYPWDTEEHKSDSTLYTGVASTFERLGFEVAQRRAPHKPMMRMSLTRRSN